MNTHIIALTVWSKTKEHTTAALTTAITTLDTMPKFARNSNIDLDETYSPFLNKHAPMQCNIRTKTNMHRTHHCEDKECGGGALKAKCIAKLHFAFCLAPVVDEDFGSPTHGEVVIHGERFVVLSPQGCAEHPYHAEYN
jgi:hypothetical protein